ncbi:Rim20p [Rhodotorula paludigena]|uniref:Rim20p n=1 Tax=Rhodotorula paludigena TaxID=86838 RepID=UPI00316C1C40
MSANNLLSLPFKATDQVATLADQVVAHIAATSETTHPDLMRADAHAWQHLRDRIFAAPTGAVPLLSQAALSDLTAYYAQLTFVLTKLPANISVSFPWYPLYTSPSPLPSASGAFPTVSPVLSLPNLEYERLSVLYNLAALHAALGTERRRSDEAGIKAAIAAYQNAAGVLSHLLRLLPRLKSSLEGLPPPTDLTAACISALRDLCLAQAQEVAWQKAVMDRLKNGTVAKIALRVAELYQQARDSAESARNGTETSPPFAFPDEVLRYLAIKAAHFAGVAQYRRSLDDLGANRYGDELGRLQLADQKLKEAAGLSKRGIPEAVVHDMKSLHKIVAENLARATKDNDLIYLATPTPASSLPFIVSAALAKPTLAPELLDPLSHLHAGAGGLGRPFLEALIPREAGEVLALWDDRKKERLEEGVLRPAKELDAAAAKTLADLNLPAALEATQQPLGVPPTLLEKSTAVQAEGGLERLETMMQDVRRVAKVNQKMLQESNELLDQEAETDAAHRSGHGTMRWTRPPSDESAAPLRQRAEQLVGLLGAAGESDSLVRNKFGEWEEAIRTLVGGQPTLARAIPSSTASATALPPRKLATIRQLRASLDQLNDLRAARARIVDAARTGVMQADIRDKVLREAERRAAQRKEGEGEGAGLAEFEGLLEAEGERVMQPYEEEIRRSGARQEDLLSEIKVLNDSFVDAGQSDSATHEREQALQHFDTAASKYHEMLTNLQEGLRFYADLSKLLGELRDACKSFTYARSAEAQDLSRALSAPPPLASASPAPTVEVTPPDTLAVPTPSRSSRQSQQTDGTPRSTRTSARTRAAGATSAGTPTRRSARAAAQVPTAAGEDPGEEQAPRTRAQAQEPAPAPAAAGGWDPSQGIRFG